MAAFRFALQASQAASPAAWRELARKAEDLGYSTLYVPDHLDDQWAPMVALTVAAEATTTLRVGTLVLDNDFRHPVVLAKEAATLDVVTGGRFEFGIGAGWMTTDYEQSGIPMEPPSVRVARLAESLEIMRAMWRDRQRDLQRRALPGDRGDRHPGAGRRPAARRSSSAAAAGASSPWPGSTPTPSASCPSLAAGHIGPEVAAESVVEKYADRVRWAREAAGERAGDLELQCWTVAVQVVPNADEVVESLAPLFDLTPDQLRAAPIALIGTPGRSSRRCASGARSSASATSSCTRRRWTRWRR